jgi:hypothetical protein
MSVKRAVPISIGVLDSVSRNCEISIQFQTKNYRYTSHWFSSTESGGKFTISIKGKPGFCVAALQSVIQSAKDSVGGRHPVDVFAANVSELKRWEYRVPWKDLFRPAEELNLTSTGSDWSSSSGFARYSESGSKLAMTVKGKAGFTQIAAAQLQSNTSLLNAFAESFTARTR